jgi:hypothetical protein
MNILLLILAIIISLPIFIVGLIFNIITLWKIKKAKNFFLFIYNLTKSVYKVLDNLFKQIAWSIDVLANVISGNALNYFFIQKEYYKDSLYGKSGISISMATGYALNRKIFIIKDTNNNNFKFANFIDYFFGVNHCINAYKWFLVKKEFNEKYKLNK